jgi:hypothetical protein
LSPVWVPLSFLAVGLAANAVIDKMAAIVTRDRAASR